MVVGCRISRSLASRFMVVMRNGSISRQFYSITSSSKIPPRLNSPSLPVATSAQVFSSRKFFTGAPRKPDHQLYVWDSSLPRKKLYLFVSVQNWTTDHTTKLLMRRCFLWTCFSRILGIREIATRSTTFFFRLVLKFVQINWWIEFYFSNFRMEF